MKYKQRPLMEICLWLPGDSRLNTVIRHTEILLWQTGDSRLHTVICVQQHFGALILQPYLPEQSVRG